MDKKSVSASKVFAMEIDDRTEEERKRDKEASKSRSKKIGPMDSNLQPECLGAPREQVRFNSDFSRAIQGESVDPDEERFGWRRLFRAAASGDVEQLRGLEEYLCGKNKHLSDSLYNVEGKTVLSKALMNLKKESEIVEYLLDIAERMGDVKEFINIAHTDEFYKGQTALHVAVERRSLHHVQLLVEKGADVHARACGKFFQKHDGPSFYFGELPLSLAACTNQTDVVDFLLDNPYEKVDVKKADSRGNTVLHALVMVADNTPENTTFIIEMYDHILTKTASLHPEVENSWNQQGLTPIKLAAKTGKTGLLEHMMQREFHDPEFLHLSRKFTEWVYGPVHSSVYDVDSLDSYHENSVLEIIIYGDGIPNRLEMLQLEPLNRLVEEKWERFSHQMFSISFLVYVLYLCVFSLVGYFWKSTTAGNVRFAGQIIVLVGASYLIFNWFTEVRRKHGNLKSALMAANFELLFFLQALCYIIAFFLCWSSSHLYVAFLASSLALAWINLIYFCRGIQQLGIYSVMIQKVFFGDIGRFLLVYITVLIGFSAAIVTLLHGPANPTNITSDEGWETSNDSKDYKDIYISMQELFKFTIGMGDLEFSNQYDNKVVFYALLISYIVLTYIMLFNMLIALMSKTVERVSEESVSIWRTQRAVTILDIEKKLQLFQCLKDKFRTGEVKNVGQEEDEDHRHCLRVEEVQWNDWNANLGIIHDAPYIQKSNADTFQDKGSRWNMLRKAASRLPRPNSSVQEE
ncbi:transient receptor potential cation channel subfamily V member 1-like [Denticeps clupeoides]|uniref:Ion transport domain-containing protein n=1 Tax=Denticeps clupeoides TaxID=299321 RepID=A0AAY4ERN8_9TELE|nr:transient receptor potential cation channel subfamily V member 1-like [Denticeps clupeoides]